MLPVEISQLSLFSRERKVLSPAWTGCRSPDRRGTWLNGVREPRPSVHLQAGGRCLPGPPHSLGALLRRRSSRAALSWREHPGSTASGLVRWDAAPPGAPSFPAPQARALSSGALMSSDTREPLGSHSEPEPALLLAVPPVPQAHAGAIPRPPAPRLAPPRLQPAQFPCLCKARLLRSDGSAPAVLRPPTRRGGDTPCWVSLIFNGKHRQVPLPCPCPPRVFSLLAVFPLLPSP